MRSAQIARNSSWSDSLSVPRFFLQTFARSEAETVWRTFKELTSNKALKDCTRDDGRIYATERELHYLDETPVRIELNDVTVRPIVGGPQSAKSEFEMFDAAHDERPTVPKKNGDDEILDTYLNHRNIEGYAARFHDSSPQNRFIRSTPPRGA